MCLCVYKYEQVRQTSGFLFYSLNGLRAIVCVCVCVCVCVYCSDGWEHCCFRRWDLLLVSLRKCVTSVLLYSSSCTLAHLWSCCCFPLSLWPAELTRQNKPQTDPTYDDRMEQGSGVTDCQPWRQMMPSSVGPTRWVRDGWIFICTFISEWSHKKQQHPWLENAFKVFFKK